MFFWGLWGATHATENAKYLDYVSDNFPSPARVWMGPNLYIFVHDAQYAEQVLKGRLTTEKPKVYEAIRDALGGDGLFSSNGELFSLAIRNGFIKANSIFIHWLRRGMEAAP